MLAKQLMLAPCTPTPHICRAWGKSTSGGLHVICLNIQKVQIKLTNC